MTRILILLSVGVVFAGCASNPSVGSLTSEQRQRAARIVEVPSDSLQSGTYRVVGSAKGLACKRNLYTSGRPSIEEAQQGVRIRAALMNADAVTNVLCEDKQEVDWAHNCWQTVVCVGDAIAFTDKSLLGSARSAVPAQKAIASSVALASQTRSMALRWDGYASLISGTISLVDDGRRGSISALLPNGDGSCSGSFVYFTPTTGQWTVVCTNSQSATGTFDAFGSGKGSSGRGKDSKGNLVEFTIGGSS